MSFPTTANIRDGLGLPLKYWNILPLHFYNFQVYNIADLTEIQYSNRSLLSFLVNVYIGKLLLFYIGIPNFQVSLFHVSYVFSQVEILARRIIDWEFIFKLL